MARIGLWGGSFNPPTLTHKVMADHAMQALQLDQLWWIVSPHNPLKDIRTLAPFAHRLAMVTVVLKDISGMKASDVEHHLGSSLTLNTLAHIRHDFPHDPLFWLMGEDNWNTLHLWEDAAGLFDYASIAVMRRPESGDLQSAKATQQFQPRQVENPDRLQTLGTWCILENPQMNISATQVRNALHVGATPAQLDPRVFDYIKRHHLYQPEG